MLNRLTYGALLVGPLLSVAIAAPPPNRPPADSPLFEITSVERGDADRPQRKVLSSTKVYASGAWTVEDQTTPRTTTGHLDNAIVKEIADDLARAKWQHFYTRPRCPPAPPVTTELWSNGVELWVEPSCGVQLDAESAKLLGQVRTLVEEATTPASATCAPSGTPVVELDERDRTTSIYGDGSWTRDLHPNGALLTSPGAHEQRCLGQDVIAKVQADLKAAPWTISHPIHCMATSTARTIVKVNGKIVFTERMCNPDALDDKSARLLLEIERLMDATP